MSQFQLQLPLPSSLLDYYYNLINYYFCKASGQVEMPTPLSGGVIPATALPQGAQMTMQARRLYCGNLPFGITEVNYYIIKEILNEKL